MEAMSRKLDDLTPQMQDKAKLIKELCAKSGVELLIYCSGRTLTEQARTYRQSRTTDQIKHKAAALMSRGYKTFADALLNCGPCPGVLGQHVTNAAPGESWHSYGEAFDAAPVVDGKICCDTFHHRAQWQVYGQAIESVGLTWGASFKDYPHCQRFKLSPLHVYTPENIDQYLIEG